MTGLGLFVGNAGSNPAYASIVDYIKNTADSLPDLNPPAISNLSTDSTLDSVVLNALTDELATVVVQYGLTDQFELGSVGPTASATSHELTIGGLSAETAYYLRVVATDSSGNSSTSDLTASTLALGQNTAPQIMSGTLVFAKQIVDSTVTATHAVLAADFDGDLDIDMVATDFEGDAVIWFENDGSQNFQRRILDSNSDGAYPAHVADVDGDGDFDVLAMGYEADTLAWYENDGTGSFTRHDIDTAANGAHSVVTVDMDADGDIDLVTTEQDSGTVAWYENDGFSSFTRRSIDDFADGAKRADAADLDGDGDLDVAAVSFFADELAWYSNDGSQGFTKIVIDSSIRGAYHVAPVDMDDDGDIDLLTASRLDNTVVLYLNDGLATFTKQTLDTLATGARGVLASDIDRDGDLDVFASSADNDTITLYENDGIGGFGKQKIDRNALGAYGLFTIDIDFDGDIDLLSASRDANAVAIHYQERSHVAAVEQSGTLIIDDSLLLTVDSDDGPAELTYAVTQSTQFGELSLSGSPLVVGSTFTQRDVDQGLLQYDHTGTGTESDYFAFTVRDGGEGGVNPSSGDFAIVVNAAVAALSLSEAEGAFAQTQVDQRDDGLVASGAPSEVFAWDSQELELRYRSLFGSSDERFVMSDVRSWRVASPTIVDQMVRVSATSVESGVETPEAVANYPWQNFLQPGDVNNDGSVTALDALQIVNELTRRQFSDFESNALHSPLRIQFWPGVYFDQNGDGKATALDALRVINELVGGEGAVQSRTVGATDLQLLEPKPVRLSSEELIRDAYPPPGELTSTQKITNQDGASRPRSIEDHQIRSIPARRATD